MDIGPEIEGWYVDPFGHHELRWFSGGTPTRLVSDAGVTSNDEPPSATYAGPLVEPAEVAVPHETVRVGDGEPSSSTEPPATMFGLP